MNKNQKPSMSKRRATVAAVLCFVAAIAIAGTYTFNDYRKTQKNELAKAEEKISKNESDKKKDSEATKETGTSKIKSEGTGNSTTNSTTGTDSTGSGKSGNNGNGKNGQTTGTGTGTGTTGTSGSDGTGTAGSSGQNGTGTQATAGKSHNINFTEDSYILWPVNGAVIMSYSMDKTVYFQTLDQYKYNPAVIIEGAEGDQVLCGAPGIIKSIDVSAQTGTTVNVDIGNGYELLYGQLKEVPVKVGDYVEAKSVLGYVSQPTKYYSKEGCNVYFEMRKDGQPVNPVEYTADQD